VSKIKNQISIARRNYIYDQSVLNLFHILLISKYLQNPLFTTAATDLKATKGVGVLSLLLQLGRSVTNEQRVLQSGRPRPQRQRGAGWECLTKRKILYKAGVEVESFFFFFFHLGPVS
jgi:hypothetical protein